MEVYDILVLLSYLVFFLLFFFLIRLNRKIAIINIVVFISYSILLFYNLYYNSKGGLGLAWGILILFITGIHFICVLCYLIYKIKKPN